jgi:hypothetical protein
MSRGMGHSPRHPTNRLGRPTRSLAAHNRGRALPLALLDRRAAAAARKLTAGPCPSIRSRVGASRFWRGGGARVSRARHLLGCRCGTRAWLPRSFRSSTAAQHRVAFRFDASVSSNVASSGIGWCSSSAQGTSLVERKVMLVPQRTQDARIDVIPVRSDRRPAPRTPLVRRRKRS